MKQNKFIKELKSQLSKQEKLSNESIKNISNELIPTVEALKCTGINQYKITRGKSGV